MAQLYGKNGAIAIGAAASTIAYLDSWTLNFTGDKDEVTAFGQDFHTFLPTLQGATGSASGKSDPVASGQTSIRTMFCSGASVTTVALWLTESSGLVFTCSSVLIDGFSLGVPVANVQTFSFSFTVNARPSHS